MTKFEKNKTYHKTLKAYLEAAIALKPQRIHVYRSMINVPLRSDLLENRCIEMLGIDSGQISGNNSYSYGISFIGQDNSFHRYTDAYKLDRHDEKSLDKLIAEKKLESELSHKHGIDIVEGLISIEDDESRRYQIFKANLGFVGCTLIQPEIMNIFLAWAVSSAIINEPKNSQNASSKAFFDTIRRLEGDVEIETVLNPWSDKGISRIEATKGVDSYILYLADLESNAEIRRKMLCF